jgi:predicted amidohydrolase YtcJ
MAALGLGAAPAPETVDLLIRGGTVYTGSGAPFVGDVAVVRDRIRAVGPRLGLSARRTVDAKGMIVAPGFIDPHTHIGDQLVSDEARTRLIPAF